jgi:hypothetical protein
VARDCVTSVTVAPVPSRAPSRSATADCPRAGVPGRERVSAHRGRVEHVGALTALLTLLTLLAPARKRSRLSPAAEQGLRALLDSFGSRDSLGYFALRGDKTAIFSPTCKAAVVYRVVGGVTLAAGDPLLIQSGCQSPGPLTLRRRHGYPRP